VVDPPFSLGSFDVECCITCRIKYVYCTYTRTQGFQACTNVKRKPMLGASYMLVLSTHTLGMISQ
jgi:hypothetical protein